VPRQLSAGCKHCQAQPLAVERDTAHRADPRGTEGGPCGHRFDPGRGFQFYDFRFVVDMAYIMREPHDYGRPIRIPIHAAEFFGRICRIAAQDDIDLNAAGDEDIRRIAAQMASSRKKIAVTEKIIRKTLVTITTAQSVSSLDRKINREEGARPFLN